MRRPSVRAREASDGPHPAVRVADGAGAAAAFVSPIAFARY
jgi:hypothetical protein